MRITASWFGPHGSTAYKYASVIILIRHSRLPSETVDERNNRLSLSPGGNRHWLLQQSQWLEVIPLDTMSPIQVQRGGKTG
jgi:hypothetical protein